MCLFVVSQVLSTILRRTLITKNINNSPRNSDDIKLEFRDGRSPIFIPKSQFPNWVSPWFLVGLVLNLIYNFLNNCNNIIYNNFLFLYFISRGCKFGNLGRKPHI
jgi:hypothetical protein